MGTFPHGAYDVAHMFLQSLRLETAKAGNRRRPAVKARRLGHSFSNLILFCSVLQPNQKIRLWTVLVNWSHPEVDIGRRFFAQAFFIGTLGERLSCQSPLLLQVGGRERQAALQLEMIWLFGTFPDRVRRGCIRCCRVLLVLGHKQRCWCGPDGSSDSLRADSSDICQPEQTRSRNQPGRSKWRLSKGSFSGHSAIHCQSHGAI